MPPTSFTRHAWKRVVGRLSLTPAEVAVILDHDLAIPIGEEGGRVHKVFYSSPDEMCFVAVQDACVGAVVTVLPPDYHNAWAVSQQVDEEARKVLLEGPLKSPYEPSNAADGGGAGGHVGVAATVFRVGCYFMARDGSVRAASLGSMPLSRVNGRLANVLEQDDVLEDIEERAGAARRLGEVVERVFVSSGKKKANMMWIHLEVPSRDGDAGSFGKTNFATGGAYET